jgi:hypothetical protein
VKLWSSCEGKQDEEIRLLKGYDMQEKKNGGNNRGIQILTNKII